MSRRVEVGAANDPAEREADLAAEQACAEGSRSVMRGGKVTTGDGGTPNDQPGALRMKANSAASGVIAAPTSVESKINSKRGKARPEQSRRSGALPNPLQQKLSHTFGTDFSGVKVHTDSTSHGMNAELGAKAFTQGSDMFFGKGQYAPGTPEGDRLIAHEAAHVVQGGDLQRHRQNPSNDHDGKSIKAKFLPQSGKVSDPMMIVGTLTIEYDKRYNECLEQYPISYGTLPVFKLRANRTGTIKIQLGGTPLQAVSFWRFMVVRTGEIFITDITRPTLPPAPNHLALKIISAESLPDQPTPTDQGRNNTMIGLSLNLEGELVQRIKEATIEQSFSKTNGSSSSTSTSEELKYSNTTTGGGSVEVLSLENSNTFESTTGFTWSDETHEEKTNSIGGSISAGKQVSSPISRGTIVFSARFESFGQQEMYERGKYVYFDTGKSVLKPSEKNELSALLGKNFANEQIVEVESGWGHIVVEGFADTVGEELRNVNLGLNRAKAVKQEILRLLPNWNEKDITPISRGEYTSLHPDGFDDPISRRADITYIKKQRPDNK